MIFIHPSLVLHHFAGAPPDWLLSKLFNSVVRKSVKNWVQGKPGPSHGSKQKMLAELRLRYGAEWLTDEHGAQNWFSWEALPNDSVSTPWCFLLARLQDGMLFGYFKGSSVEGVNILPAGSIEELRLLEDSSSKLNERIQQNDFEGAMSLLRGEMDNYVLFQRQYFGSRWPENIPDMFTLQKALCVATVDSLLYVLALLALSLSKDENGFSEAPNFVRYVPALENGSWNLPLEQWFEELRLFSGSSNLSELARKITGANKLSYLYRETPGKDHGWRAARYNIYRWKGNAKILPPWDAAIDMVSALVKQDDASAEDIRLYVLFAVARTMQAAHQFFLDHGFSDDVLNTIYSGYGQWYHHHYDLNAKTSPK